MVLNIDFDPQPVAPNSRIVKSKLKKKIAAEIDSIRNHDTLLVDVHRLHTPTNLHLQLPLALNLRQLFFKVTI